MYSNVRIVGAIRAVMVLSVVVIISSMGLPLATVQATTMPSFPVARSIIGADTSSRPAPGVVDQASRPSAASFEFTFEGVPPEAHAAFQYAADIWGRQLTSSVPIKIHAKWSDSYSPDLDTGKPHGYIANFPNAPQRDTLYPIALANKLAGYDLRTNGADDFDIDMTFRDTSNWYFGTDGNIGTKKDFATVVLRAIAHGLGFTASLSLADDEYVGRWGKDNGFPYIFDRFMVDEQGRNLLDTTVYPNPSSELARALTHTTYWSGENGRAAAGNQRPALNAYDRYESLDGRMFLDEDTYPQGDANALMTLRIAYDGAIHDPGPIVRGMLKDIGWETQAGSFPGTPVGSLEIIPMGGLDDGRAFTGASEVTVYVRNTGGSAERLRLEVDGSPIYDGVYQGGTGRRMVLRVVIPSFSGCAPKTIVGTLEGNGERSTSFAATMLVDGGVDATVAVSGTPGALTWSPQTPRFKVPLDPNYTLGNSYAARITATAGECTQVSGTATFVKRPVPMSGQDGYLGCFVCGNGGWTAPDGEYQFYIEVTDGARNVRRFPSETGVYTLFHDSVAPKVSIDNPTSGNMYKDGLTPGYALVDLSSFHATDNLYPDQGNQQEYYGYWVTQYLWTDIAPDQIDPPGGEVWYKNGYFVRGRIPSTILLPIRREPGTDPDDTLNRYRVWVRVVDGAGNISKAVSPKATMTTDVATMHLPQVLRMGQ